MRLSDIDYELPSGAIAQSAIEPRDASRLLVCHESATYSDARVSDLPDILRDGDLLVANDTRVLNARVSARRVSGAVCEVLFLRPCSDSADAWWEALVKPSRRIRAGERLTVVPGPTTDESAGAEIEAGEILAGGRRLVRGSNIAVADLLVKSGEIPLPPYFAGHLQTPGRYQTVFAKESRSAAAPTAGLHFTKGLLESLERRGIEIASVSLDVGVDTFRPIVESDPLEHEMHEEFYRIGEQAALIIGRAKAEGRRVIAIGTTSTRAIESAALRDANGIPTGEVRSAAARTSIMISPGHRFLVDGLLTNFHAPRSTLLLLLAAIYPSWRDAYGHALASGYRFLSFGDAMLILPSPTT